MSEWMMSEAEGYDLLRSYGVPVPSYRIVNSEQEAAEVAEEIGFPVVMKIISPDVVHKSDAGGVITGIGGREAAAQAFKRIMGNVLAAVPNASITGVIIEEQADPGLELIIGGKTDKAFGKVITFGIGGTLVELMKDVTLRILPLEADDVRGMIREINAYPLLTGYRGMKPKDSELLVTIILSVSRMFLENQRIQEFDINPLRLYEKGACAVDARIILTDAPEVYTPSENIPVPMEYFNPRSIAVIGASQDPSKMGYAVMHNLLHFPGQLYPVNNKRADIQGLKAYPTVLSIPAPVDLAVISVPAIHVPRVVEECGQKGVPMVVIITAGFREMGPEGKALEDRIVQIAHSHGTRIIGPNCLGVIIPPRGIDTTYVRQSPYPGTIAFISQSGAIINTVVDWSISANIGFSAVISVGNQSDLNFLDYLKFVRNDERTKAVILYIEEVHDGRAFMDVVSEVAKTKPVIAIKSGSSQKGQKAASSHTGSLSGSYDVYMEAFRRSGVVVVHTLTGAFLAAEMLAHPKGYPKGKRAVVITNAGGFAVLSSDYSERYGIDLIDLPQQIIEELNGVLPDYWNKGNPIDLLGDASASRFEQTFRVLSKHSEIWDIAFIVGFPNLVLTSEDLAHQILAFSGMTENRIVASLLGGESMDVGRKILKDHGIPNFGELDFTYRVVGRVLWQKFRTRAPGLL